MSYNNKIPVGRLRLHGHYMIKLSNFAVRKTKRIDHGNHYNRRMH